MAKYEDPIEGYRFCHNTEIAGAYVIIYRNGDKIKELSCIGRAFFEYALPYILDVRLPQIKYIVVL